MGKCDFPKKDLGGIFKKKEKKGKMLMEMYAHGAVIITLFDVTED